MSRRLPTLALTALVLVAGAGCSGEDSGSTGTEPRVDPQQVQLPPARTLPIPGQETAGAESGAGASPHDHGVYWRAPDDWVKEAPANQMRKAQYRAPGPGGEAECVVYYFGPGMGGDADSNARRWALQFEQPDGRPSTEVMRLSELDGGRVPVRIVEVTGTYDGGMAMTGAEKEKLTGYKLLGGIAQGPDALWFFKFTGPQQTIDQQRDAFMAMLRSFGEGA
jgi:hypothetical protein